MTILQPKGLHQTAKSRLHAGLLIIWNPSSRIIFTQHDRAIGLKSHLHRRSPAAWPGFRLPAARTKAIQRSPDCKGSERNEIDHQAN